MMAFAMRLHAARGQLSIGTIGAAQLGREAVRSALSQIDITEVSQMDGTEPRRRCSNFALRCMPHSAHLVLRLLQSVPRKPG